MSFITVEKLWKEYGRTIVLENLNLKVEQGEFCTLVGASGCGKSTFLKMLLGQERPTRGELALEGQDFPGEPDRNRGIVFQRYSVFPHLTVRQNVLMGLELEQKPFLGRLFGQARRDALEKVDRMIESVGLAHARDKWPHELSGGMQQRLAIAQSFIMRPRVLLLDEPFGALDPGIRGDMHELILKLWRDTGTTIFMVT
ncbi:MAG: ATP-binding cassette domain-containing protein, partial [Marinobacter sp.]